MKKVIFLIGLLALLSLLTVGNAVIAQDDLPAFADMTAGEWTEVVPAGDTVCMYDTEYSFFVRPADEPTDNLMIYFEGGGACWDGFTCGAIGQFASQYEIADNEMEFYVSGMFDYANPMNPVADYNTVFVPYCTGDIHSGNSVVTFEVPAEQLDVDYDEIEVHFNGFTNSQTVLDWTFANFMEPEQVFVTGCSAGGYGASTHAPYVMEHYAGTRVVHMADAANGVSPPEPDLLALWNVSEPDFIEIGEYDATNFTTVAQLAIAQAYPDNVVSQYNHALDNVQVGFFGLLSGTPVSEENFMDVGLVWASGLQGNLTRLEAEAENFHSFTAGGFGHCVTGGDTFYQYTVQDLTVSDWVGSLLSGEDMTSVQCDIASGECFADPVVEEE